MPINPRNTMSLFGVRQPGARFVGNRQHSQRLVGHFTCSFQNQSVPFGVEHSLPAAVNCRAHDSRIISGAPLE